MEGLGHVRTRRRPACAGVSPALLSRSQPVLRCLPHPAQPQALHRAVPAGSRAPNKRKRNTKVPRSSECYGGAYLILGSPQGAFDLLIAHGNARCKPLQPDDFGNIAFGQPRLGTW